MRRFWLLSCGVAASAAIALASGVALLMSTGHGATFYLHNPVFYIKLAIFAAMLLIAITPARMIVQWQREAATGALPEAGMVLLVRRYLTIEICLLLAIPLAASLATRGIGGPVSAS